MIFAGCDEAGRGCLAGPVFAASVILPRDFKHPLLNDSKKMNEKNRNILREVIEREAIHYGVAKIDPKEIDKINILNASFKAMHKSIKKLSVKPQLLLIDGNRFNPLKGYNYTCIIKGDAKYLSIAAASVLAKTYRDEYMQKIHIKHPIYHWNTNKGYATKAHRHAVRDYGRSRHHRKTFTVKELDMPELFE